MAPDFTIPIESPVESFEQPHEEILKENGNEVPARNKRRRIAKSFDDDFIVYLVDDTPTSITEAYASLDADDWKVVRSEIDSILSNEIWELSELPFDCKPIGCKWVFKKKLRPDGTIDKYKARLVAKGYTQKEGENLFDTYSSVARMTMIRVLLSLAASYGLLVHQMDVKTAFLNGELDEEIYMDQPDGFVVKGEEQKGIPPPQIRKEGDGVSQNSKGSGSYGPATPPPRVRPDGAGVLELTVEDTDALDCGVCFLPLKPPIFQCSNGHVVCSLCHDKLKATGKCHVCGVTTDGNSRCHAMERLAESIRFLCSNAAYGCTARLVYHDRGGHWQQCPHGVAIGPLACVHGWPSFTTALASGHFNVSLHDGFNFLRAEDHASSSPGILFILNVVRMPLGRAISMLCIDTRAANNGQGQFSKEPIECELTYSRYVSSKSHSTSDQLIVHYQRCKFRVALTDLSNGLPSTDDCFQFVVPNFALGEENKETVQVEGRIFISSINLC
ncbi:uncharacterized protein [Miscanthus floridulus]|uniref:uncharacterized protein n=1 Tax=Miscanthus floridulus TaxID=154761 RepID=UPI003459D53E